MLHRRALAQRGLDRPFGTPLTAKARYQSADDVLSKSMGDIPGSDLAAAIRRSQSETAQISQSGYLLLRSNEPNLDCVAFPNLCGDAEEISTSPSIHSNSNVVTQQNTTTTTTSKSDLTVDDIESQQPQRPPQTKSGVEHSSDMLAAFFGLAVEVPSEPLNEEELPQHRPTEPPIHSKSAPITFQIVQSRKAPPVFNRVVVPSPPTNNETHHQTWKSKYCVLHDGVLYCYSNESVGESLEAQAERRQKQQQHAKHPDKAIDWSTSPQAGVCWEKRVALENVGAVRSAELEYGSCAFELIAGGDDEEQEDRLVLKASNAEEMYEWLFQFHRSLASFMKTIVDAMETTTMMIPAPTSGSVRTHMDLHDTTTTQPLPLVSPDVAPSTPRFGSSFRKPNYLSTPLSHGHGRSNLHRRLQGGEGSGSPSDQQQESPPAIPFPFAPPETVTPSAEAEPTNREPEVTNTASCPETERPTTPAAPTSTGKYVPPHMRQAKTKRKAYVPLRQRQAGAVPGQRPMTLAERAAATSSPPAGGGEAIDTKTPSTPPTKTHETRSFESFINEPTWTAQTTPWIYGGCADPRFVAGSIMDTLYSKRGSSKLGKVRTQADGGVGGTTNSPLQWEFGAISEIGIRSYNEDSFLACSNLAQAFGNLAGNEPAIDGDWGNHDPGVFCIFDGHCGNEAARYATEHFTDELYREWKQSNMKAGEIDVAVKRALASIDNDFCRICTEGERNWESGSTAIIVAVDNEELIVSNLGDSEAVLCRSQVPTSILDDSLIRDGWTQFDEDSDHQTSWIKAMEDPEHQREWYWKHVADVHSPSRADEKERIENANGWITTETDIPIGQLHRMDFCDEDVLDILKRCFSDRYSQLQPSAAQPQRILRISRVCGELAVSRALGDRDFKAAFNEPSPERSDWWHSTLPVPYPENHSRSFKGDVITSVAESQTITLSQDTNEEFLVVACDGLWDVMDPADAVRVVRGLLYDKKWHAKKAAARLAELAIHLGSADNITVIVIRFFRS